MRPTEPARTVRTDPRGPTRRADTRSQIMPVYMVDRDLPGVTLDALGAAQAKAIATADEFRQKGRDIRYIRSTFVPGESHCMCLFEASDADLVAELNDEAGIPYTRVAEALDLTP